MQNLKFPERLEMNVETLKRLRSHLEGAQDSLRCTCYNWMGGCNREWHCPYGHLKAALEQLSLLEKNSHGV